MLWKEFRKRMAKNKIQSFANTKNKDRKNLDNFLEELNYDYNEI
jgi:hypothetical protein